MYEIALAFSVLCFFAVTTYFVRSPAFSFFHPFTIYTLFHGLVFVFRPIVARISQFKAIYLAFGFVPSDSDKITAILAADFGYMVFAYFCLRAGSVPMRFGIDKFTTAEKIELGRLFPWVLATVGPVSAYSLFVNWNISNLGATMDNMSLDVATGTFIHTGGGGGYLYEVQLALATSCALIAWIYRFKLFSMVPIGFFVLFRAGTGGRGPFVIALVTLGLLFLYEKRQKFVNIKVGLVLVFALFLFNAIGADRGASVRSFTTGQAAEESVFDSEADLKFLEGMDSGNLEFMEYLVYVVPQRSGTYDYFLSNLQLFTEPIPRAWWSGKPVGAPFKRIDLFAHGHPLGMTSSLPGFGWFSLGWIGVAVWCGLWGHVLGLIYRKYVEGPQNTLQTAAYMIFIPMLVVGYRDGGLLTIFRQGLFFLLPVIVWFAVSKVIALPKASVMRARAVRRWRKAQFAKRKEAGEVPAPEMSSMAAAEKPRIDREEQKTRLGERRRQAFQRNRMQTRQ